MELERRGVVAPLVVTETFLPLVQAQARARRVEPRLVVVPHPVGGLNEAELAGRIEGAAAELLRMADEARGGA
ncbi:hypothetical protein SAMN04488546_1684 [Geodermatophilus poikilotrophus]|uniref:UGSC-like domain-containing protein n=1 Tax=Geodermatophilus poikilotrophus TaxID=1333667 RepID=A0A1I0CP21_9ACTN|nr:hypothetical protein [Geodermatophilus poikilotrophus]SET21239.1 hypothetical protein SAMN04488546_1684 [Geodermatophilus poikilotrophus]